MKRNFLAEIIARKRELIARSAGDMNVLRERTILTRENAARHRLRAALSDSSRPHVIAEFKRRSPALGAIRNDAQPAMMAALYERGGARAISVLTDEDYFGGSIADLIAARAATTLPLLRKDFIIDDAQVYETALIGASALLLIAAALDDDSLGRLRSIAEDDLHLDALVEVHTAEELRRAVNCGARLIGVNNRNLETFVVSLETSERLIASAPHDAVMISESGLRTREEIARLHRCGYRGFLIGEALMRAPDPEAALRDLIAAIRPASK